MIYLGVNVDHVATIRQARRTSYPDPVIAATLAEMAGADGITVHLREDRRHIQERDVDLLLRMLQTKLNLESAATEEMVTLVCQYKPADCCLVPERREELTTEGGLDVVTNRQGVGRAVERLLQSGVRVSLFIDPDFDQIAAAVAIGAPVIELHTGRYADAESPNQRRDELERLRVATMQGRDKGLIVNAGHGLHYQNVQPIARIAGMHELNIGHAIIARAMMVGIERAVREMKQLLQQGSPSNRAG